MFKFIKSIKSRYSRVNGSIAVNTKTTKKQNNTFLNNEKFLENFNKKKELPFEYKDKLNLKNDCIRSSNSQVRFQFHPNLEIPASRHHQPTRSKSVSNNPEFSRNSSKSQLVSHCFFHSNSKLFLNII